MKKLLHIASVIMMLTIVTACADNTNNQVNNSTDSEPTNSTEINNNNDTTNNQNDEASAEIEEQQTTWQEKMGELNFQEFELEVDYPDDVDYDMSVIKDSSGFYEAEVINQVNNLEFKGIPAFNEIHISLEKIDISKDSSETEVIDEVISAFGLVDGYNEIEIEITFNDGTEKEYEIEY